MIYITANRELWDIEKKKTIEILFIYSFIC